MSTKHPFSEVAHAAIDGKQVQFRGEKGKWIDAIDQRDIDLLLMWKACSSFEWRVKPEPVTVRSRRYWYSDRHGRVGMDIAENGEHPERGAFGFVSWLEDWQTNEVPQTQLSAALPDDVSQPRAAAALAQDNKGPQAMEPVPSMNRWEALLTPHEERRLGKTGEELAELLAVVCRIQIQGLDGVDPATGKTNRQRFHEETADVIAQINCNYRAFDMPSDEIDERVRIKEAWMAQWEAHYAEQAK